MKDGIFTVMDVGTTKVCTIVCGRQGSKVMVLGSAVVPSQSVRRAQVVNVEEVVEAVQASLEKAERAAGVHIRSVRGYVSVNNLVESLGEHFRQTGVKANWFVLEPLADSNVILSAEERQQGVVLADIGGGTTNIVVCSREDVVYAAIIPVAGYQFTNDLAFGLRTPYPAAEELKLKYGHALPNSVPADETVEVQAFGSETTRTVPRREICAILEARARELTTMIQSEIRRCGMDRLPAGLVLSGGGSCLPGFVELTADMLKMPVRIGAPLASLGVPQELCHPAYATALALAFADAKGG